jgi:hypothetical protein
MPTSDDQARRARPRPPLLRECRRAGRRPAADLVSCHIEWGGRFILAPGVINLSLRGVALRLAVPLRHGERLRLLLARRAGVFTAAVQWRVARCQPAGEEFVVGGPFEEPLSPDAYRQLLG